MPTIKNKLIVAFVAAGLSAPSAYLAYDLTLPSEGLVLQPYKDPVGLQTYCVGHLALKTDVVKKSYTEEECMAIFASDWSKHLKQLDSVVKVKYKSEWQRQALNDFTFNVGIGNVKSSTLLKLVNQGRHDAACYELSKWVKGRVGGILTTLRGLVTRRDKTIPYCLGELTPDKKADYEQFLREYNEVQHKQHEAKVL